MEGGKITTKRIDREKPGYYIRNNFSVTTSGMFWDPVLSFVSSAMGSHSDGHSVSGHGKHY